MKSLQRAGGVSAFLHSFAYLFGIVMYLAVLGPIIGAEPLLFYSNLAETQLILYLWIFIAYWLAAFALVVVILNIFNTLKGESDWVLQLSCILGLIWAALIIGSGNLMLHNFMTLHEIEGLTTEKAEIIRLILGNVENGIITGNEFIGGLWALTLHIFALKNSKLQKAFNVFGIIVALLGVLSIVPPLTETASLGFGILMIVWFFWLGVLFLQKKSQA